MVIYATAELYYNEALSVTSGYESLQLIVKFKQQGKFFKVKLDRSLASAYNYHQPHRTSVRTYISIDEYYDHVEEILNDKEYVESCVIKMIKERFENENNKEKKNMRKFNIVQMTKDKPKLEIKVEIK